MRIEMIRVMMMAIIDDDYDYEHDADDNAH